MKARYIYQLTTTPVHLTDFLVITDGFFKLLRLAVAAHSQSNTVEKRPGIYYNIGLKPPASITCYNTGIPSVNVNSLVIVE